MRSPRWSLPSLIVDGAQGDCSGHGYCFATDKCACNIGFAGPSCSYVKVRDASSSIDPVSVSTQRGRQLGRQLHQVERLHWRCERRLLSPNDRLADSIAGECAFAPNATQGVCCDQQCDDPCMTCAGDGSGVVVANQIGRCRTRIGASCLDGDDAATCRTCVGASSSRRYVVVKSPLTSFSTYRGELCRRRTRLLRRPVRQSRDALFDRVSRAVVCRCDKNLTFSFQRRRQRHGVWLRECRRRLRRWQRAFVRLCVATIAEVEIVPALVASQCAPCGDPSPTTANATLLPVDWCGADVARDAF